MQRLKEKLLVIIFFLSAATIIAGMMIPVVEQGHLNANITTTFDGLWWAISTITSVGYGDHYPVTTAGRALGIFMILAGSTTFFVLTSLIAAMLLLHETKKDHEEILQKLNELERKISKKN